MRSNAPHAHSGRPAAATDAPAAMGCRGMGVPGRRAPGCAYLQHQPASCLLFKGALDGPHLQIRPWLLSLRGLHSRRLIVISVDKRRHHGRQALHEISGSKAHIRKSGGAKPQALRIMPADGDNDRRQRRHHLRGCYRHILPGIDGLPEGEGVVGRPAFSHDAPRQQETRP